MTPPLNAGRAAPRARSLGSIHSWATAALWASLALAALAPGASAQLDLPETPPPRSDLPEWLSAESRSLHEGAAANAPRPRRQATGSQLDLPRVDPRRTAPATGPAEAPAPEPAASAPEATEGAAEVPAAVDALDPAATAVLEWVARLEAAASTGDRNARDLAAGLAASGDVGLAAARIVLQGDKGPGLLLAGRHLLRHGAAGDLDRVKLRVEGRFRGQIGAQLLRALVETAPDAASGKWLVELLDHPQSSMRMAAERELLVGARPEWIGALALGLQADRADARARALNVLGRIDDPAAASALLSRLADPSAQVAWRAAERLGDHPSPELDRQLRERAFAGRLLFREQAYALLALVEREDRRNTPLMDELDVPVLLANLNSALPVVSGASAIALAGIGFRSEDREASRWLELEVPHELVRILVGETFHRDFSALEGPARRRLSLLSGQDFGADGPAWQGWWTANVRGFQARRAVLRYRPDERAGLVLALRRPGALEELVLVGPAAVYEAKALDTTVFLSEQEAERLVDELAGLGVFEARCPPGPVGTGALVGRMEMRLAGQGKVFQLGEQGIPDWALAVLGRVDRLMVDNRWQRFFDPRRFATRREFVQAESPFWAEERSPAERDRRTADLALGALAGAGVVERGPMVAELAELARREGLLVPADFEALIDALAVEPFWSERAGTLVRLALDAAGAAPGGEAGPEPVPSGAARQLVETLARAFGSAANGSLAEVLELAPLGLARTLALDERTLLRRAAAPVLARSGRPEDLEALRRLLEDSESTVEAAAVRAVGDAELEALRGEMLARARLGEGEVRTEAILALGKLGGEGVLEVLVSTVGTASGAYDGAVAEALGELGDDRAVAVLLSLLHAGPGSPGFEPARTALGKLGSAAWTDLLRLASVPGAVSRRPAALLLSSQGVPMAAPVLIELLAEDPSDAEVRLELTTLTCQELGGDGESDVAWWDWWDRSPKDDSRAWLRAAQVRQRLPVAEESSLVGAGNLQGALTLVESMRRGEAPLARRARRELERLLGEDPGTPPAAEIDRRPWFAELTTRVEAHYAPR